MKLNLNMNMKNNEFHKTRGVKKAPFRRLGRAQKDFALIANLTATSVPRHKSSSAETTR
jgi:hypothetical protein